MDVPIIPSQGIFNSRSRYYFTHSISWEGGLEGYEACYVMEG